MLLSISRRFGCILVSSIHFLQNPYTYGYVTIFGIVGYLGVNVVLTLVRISGALIAVTVSPIP